MQVLIGIVGVFGAAGVIILFSFVDINGGVKAVIIALAVFLAVYAMARIQPKGSISEKDS